MKITEETVCELAALAQLRLDADEVARMQRDLDRILGYVEQIEALDTEGVPPTAHVLDVATPLRPDEVGDVLPVELAIGNAPESEGGAVVVPKVIE